MPDMRHGTWAILRALILSERAPLYARLLWRMHQRRAGKASASILNPARFSNALNTLAAVLLFTILSALTPGACFLTYLAISDHRGTALWLLIMTGLGVIGGGSALIAGGLNRAVSLEQARGTWHDLLILPYDRADVVLNSVIHVYKPFLSMVGLVFSMAAALLATPTPIPRTGLLFLLLIVEWLEIQSLSVTVGLVSAFGRYRPAGVLAPSLIALAGALLRGIVGWSVAKTLSSGEGVRLAGILTGPLIGVVTDRWLVGLILGLFYLAVLEGVVRFLFAWGLARAGEN